MVGVRGMISRLYRAIRNMQKQNDIDLGVGKWSLDNKNPTLTLIMESLSSAYKYLPSARFLEMRLQVIHRSYLTPASGHHMGIYPTSNCFKCKAPNANLFHSL
ncbi:hypothetical protein GDO78_015954 [Eleutherodactylus coqui]|uniref:Uncharacterized protein n=1 Tax=Eleutherodactylus coqui TaxID=57060 RepID=A0A8J6B214_ELECQ|nr:hypothetical protein GDO78_015954 [Eleutherodactylus coqui]